MRNLNMLPGLHRASFLLAMAAVFAPAYAQEGGGIRPLTTAPESSLSFGLGLATGDQTDRARFGMFNGLRKQDANGLFGFGYYNRDAATGTWLGIEGRNVGLDNREFGFSYRRLGDLKFNADYSEITRHDPRTINTNLAGEGTATMTNSLLATPGTGRDLNLELKRKGLGFELQKAFGIYQLEVSFKNEDKSGTRFFGRGFACSANYVAAGVCTNAGTNAAVFLPEPVDSTIRQLDAKLNYNGEKLKLSGGYYGNFYTNKVGSFQSTFTGPLGNLNGGAQVLDPNLNTFLSTPMASWPDSQAHQFYLGGNYKWDSHTKVNFKASYTHATQHESFGSMGLAGAPGGRDNLGGILNTTKLQSGFSNHSFKDLHVHGDVSYVVKRNQTPIDNYNIHVLSATPTFGTWTNGASNTKKFDAKLEADYKLPYQMLLVGGVKYETEDAGTFTPTDVAGGIAAIRQKLETVGYRAELRKTMSEEFTGAISYVGERRRGTSPWLKVNALPLTGVFPASDQCTSTGANACVFNRTGAFAFIHEDLQRQKVRASANWTPLDRLSLQAFVDVGRDDYQGPTTSGLRNSTMYNVSLDASYEFTDNWKASAYWNTGVRTLLMGHSADYDGLAKDRATSYGLGFSGKPFAKFRIGGDATVVLDTLRYEIRPDELISATNLATLQATGGLPDVKYNLLRINLYGEYAVNKAATVRLDWIHNRTFFNEWTYSFNGTPFLYSDNTTLSAKQLQSVNFIGASYIYKFQ